MGDKFVIEGRTRGASYETEASLFGRKHSRIEVLSENRHGALFVGDDADVGERIVRKFLIDTDPLGWGVGYEDLGKLRITVERA